MNLSHCQIFAKLLSFNLRWHRTRDSLIPHRWSPECWVSWYVLPKYKKKKSQTFTTVVHLLQCVFCSVSLSVLSLEVGPAFLGDIPLQSQVLVNSIALPPTLLQSFLSLGESKNHRSRPNVALYNDILLSSSRQTMFPRSRPIKSVFSCESENSNQSVRNTKTIKSNGEYKCCNYQ